MFVQKDQKRKLHMSHIEIEVPNFLKILKKSLLIIVPTSKKTEAKGLLVKGWIPAFYHKTAKKPYQLGN